MFYSSSFKSHRHSLHHPCSRSKTVHFRTLEALWDESMNTNGGGVAQNANGIQLVFLCPMFTYCILPDLTVLLFSLETCKLVVFRSSNRFPQNHLQQLTLVTEKKRCSTWGSSSIKQRRWRKRPAEPAMNLCLFNLRDFCSLLENIRGVNYNWLIQLWSWLVWKDLK